AELQTQHSTALVGFNSLYIDLFQTGRDQHATGKIEDLVQVLLAFQFVDRGTTHHSCHRDLRTDRRHQQGIARQQMVNIRADSLQQEVVQIDLTDQLCAAVLS